MGNDEVCDLKKKDSGGITDSSSTASGLVPEETSGLRRTTRSQSNSSPVNSVRKHQRLEKQGPEVETTSPRRRSVRESKFRSPGTGSPLMNIGGLMHKNSKGSLRTTGGSRKEKIPKEIANVEKCRVEDKALKEVADEAQVKEQALSPKVGEKRKKRLDAREFKAMFKLYSPGVSDLKKRGLENSFGNAGSGVGGPGERIPEYCAKGVDNGNLKPEEVLHVESNEDGDCDLGVCDERVQENSNEVPGRRIEEPNEDPHKCCDGEEMEKDCVTKTDGSTEGQNLYARKNLCAEKPCDVKNVESRLVSEGPNLSVPSIADTFAEKNSVNVVAEEVNGFVVEKLPNQEIPSSSGTQAGMKVFRSGSPAFKLSSLAEDCAKCYKKSRLDHDSPMHELCCCLSNSVSGANFVSLCKDIGECADVANEDSWKINQIDSPIDIDQGLCVICNLAGNLLRCNGKACGRSYHPSCLWTHQVIAHIPNLYCSECMKKMLALGVHSVSEGVESIFDAREVKVSNSEGSLEKLYFVKYKGLAHIHNCWIAETQLLHEASDLLVKFNEQEKLWKPEWTVPHRLLLRRPINASKQDAEFASKSYHIWLVKWCGLDYDQATWELEDSELFKKPEAEQLLKEYETRHNEAKKSSMPGDNQTQERKKNLPVKHGRLSDSVRFECVNKLREYHQKRHNALLLDEQDRAIKIVYFISSMLRTVRRPFLIISPCESLFYWEAEFLRFTSSINVVVYDGNADSRKIIRSLEFYQDGGELMLQVLLSTVEAISEDLEVIKGMDWEAVIVDECQEHCIFRNSDCIKTLVTRWKLLLFNAQLKDTIAEYSNILSLLEPVGSYNQGLMDASNKDINVLKEMMCSFIISPRLQEYWVPVEISNVQLEQYCSLMLSNSSVLCLCSKSDSIGSLHSVLCSTQKCCDHPYLVNPSLRTFLLPEQPPQDAALDMGVKASGKLRLLDDLLSEFRNQGLKVLILYQPIGGSGKDNFDIILDDFLTWRFGEDSYEHVAFGGQPSTRKAALTKFNKERVRSFLLLETRACLPSVKLSLVDLVIILNSNWNPLNDLKDLQKIVIDSKLKPIPVLRFYCSCTVEEKALIIAKKDMIPENTQQISSSTKQLLLMWGSSYLFSRLDEFHLDKVLDYKENIVFGSSVMKDVFQEIVSIVENHGNINNSCRYLSLARLDGRSYVTNIPLLGEQRMQLEEVVSSNAFWVKLLNGKQPHWKYLYTSSERTRKRVRYSKELSLPRNVQTDEPVKKRKDYSPRRVGQNSVKIKGRNKENHGLPDVRILQQDDRKHLHEQRGLFNLKPTILRLCETLMVKDGVKSLALKFLEFVMDNHQVTREPATTLQAFQISVCWIAAEVLEKKIDHRRSLDIAREKMNFKCIVEEADTVYSKMKLLMKVFLSRNLNILKSPNDPASDTNDSTRDLSEVGVNIAVELDESPFTADGINKEVPSRIHTNNNIKESLENSDRFKKKCEKNFNRLKEKQNDELVDFEKNWEEKRVELEDMYKLESAVIRYSHANSSALVEKLKILEHNYATKRKDLSSQVFYLRKKLEARQWEEREGEQKKIAQLLKLVKPLVQDVNPQSVSNVQFQTTEDIGPYKDSNGIVSAIANLPEDQNSEPYNVENNANSAYSLENVSVFQGAGNDNLAEEKQCASAGERREVTSQMDSVLANKQAALESGWGNMSIEQLLSPISAFMDVAADETSCQVDGVEDQVRILTEISGIVAPGSETSLLDSANPVHGSQTRVASSGQLNSKSTEVQVSVQNLRSPMQHHIPQLVVSHTVAANIGPCPSYVSATGGASTSHSSHPIPLQVVNPTIPQGSSSCYSDPLQNEHDRLRSMIDEITNSHEQTKLRLKSECDKEIEEVVAQIRRKYNVKLEEAESSFLDKKKVLESNKKMVVMNKFLADALRSKSMDRAVQQGATRRGVPSSSMEALRLQSTARPLSVAHLSSVVRTASNLDSILPPARYVLPDEGFELARQGSCSAVPESAHVSASPAMASSNIMQSSSVLPLQPPTNQVPVHLTHVSAPPAVPSSDNNLAVQPSAFQSCHGVSRKAKTFRSESALNLPFTAEEFLKDIVVQNNADNHRLSDNLPALPNNMQNNESWDLSYFAADVVCLSDDD